MNDLSRLYFECHVTFTPPQSMTQITKLESLSKIYDFKLANFAMLKDGGELKAFCSARNQSYSFLLHQMVNFVMAAKAAGFRIERYKIEDTVVDSKLDGDFIGAMDEF